MSRPYKATAYLYLGPEGPEDEDAGHLLAELEVRLVGLVSFGSSARMCGHPDTLGANRRAARSSPVPSPPHASHTTCRVLSATLDGRPFELSDCHDAASRLLYETACDEAEEDDGPDPDSAWDSRCDR